jgi:hypothetical protein
VTRRGQCLRDATGRRISFNDECAAADHVVRHYRRDNPFGRLTIIRVGGVLFVEIYAQGSGSVVADAEHNKNASLLTSPSPIKFFGMCNLYSQTRNVEAIRRLFRIADNRALFIFPRAVTFQGQPFLLQRFP